jgi:flagellar protein FlaI
MSDAVVEQVLQEEDARDTGKRSLNALDKLKKSYMKKLAGKKSMKIAAPLGSQTTDKKLVEGVTTIPKIVDKNVRQIEIEPIIDGYSYVRIKYDNIANDYLYEVIEPNLTEEEEDILEVLKETLIDSLERLVDAKKEEKEAYLKKGIDSLLADIGVNLNPISKERVSYYILRDFLRYGAIDVTMTDVQVEDLSCDGTNIPLYVFHRKYGSIQSNLKFKTSEELDGFVVWLAQRCGKHISVAEPMLDATIPDGSRLQATLGMHVTKHGSSFTIRRFRENPFTPLDMIKFKTMSLDMMAYLWLCIENGKSILVCGGTASGKTTTLNAVLLFIPPQMKIVSIEDTRELNLPHENWVPLLTRHGFGGKDASGKAAGEINMFELLTAALRQRPQYMMVGEVRGQEAYVVFQAMATGKSAYTTFHAESVQTMVNRMEQPPIEVPRALLSALHMVLIQAQVKVGTKMTRRVKSLTEIVGINPDNNELLVNQVYTWNPADDTFNYGGHSYIYQQIADTKGWNQREMMREVKRRTRLLLYLRSKNVSYKNVAKYVSAYYKDPEKVMKEVDDSGFKEDV